MKVGDTVIATTTVNVRSGPRLTASVLVKLQPGEQAVLLEGPVVDELVWWRIPAPKAGWVAQSVNGVNLLEPFMVPTAWDRSIAFVLAHEGGYSNDSRDAGNWTGGRVSVGVLKGTKYGISAASYPNLDIKNLTVQQAKDIYKAGYWRGEFEWPLSLAVFDLAVNGGVQRSRQALAAVGNNFNAYMGWRIRWYTSLAQWNIYGKGWTNRCADLLTEASKQISSQGG